MLDNYMSIKINEKQSYGNMYEKQRIAKLTLATDSANFSTHDLIGQKMRMELPARTVSRHNQLMCSEQIVCK